MSENKQKFKNRRDSNSGFSMRNPAITPLENLYKNADS